MAYIGTPAAPVATVVGDNAVTTRSIAPNAVTPPKLANSGSELSFRNRIINGDMRIDQRNAGASVTPTANAYTLDRWLANVSTASKFSVQQSTTAPPGFTNSTLITSTSAYTVAAGDYQTFQQRIEAFNMSDMGWGTASAQAVTLSFWVRSSLTGTFGGSFYFPASTVRSYPFSYSISAANTWEQKTITVSGDTFSNTAPTGNSLYVIVQFALGVGSTYSGTANAWVTGNYASVTGTTNLIATSGATFYITGVQLEAGTVATPFERRDYGRELMMCQRYYQTYNPTTWGFPTFTTFVPNGDTRGGLGFVVTMRSAPTVTFSTTSWTCVGGGDNGAVINVTPVVAVAGTTVNGFAISVTNPSVLSPASGTVAMWGTNANPTYYANAEL